MVNKVLLNTKSKVVSDKDIIEVNGQLLIKIRGKKYLVNYMNVDDEHDIRYYKVIPTPVIEVLKVKNIDRMVVIFKEYENNKVLGVIITPNSLIIKDTLWFDNYYVNGDRLNILVGMDINLHAYTDEIIKREIVRLKEEANLLESILGGL